MTRDRRPTREELDLWRRATIDVDQLRKEPRSAETTARPGQADNKASMPKDCRPAANERETFSPKAAITPTINPHRPINADRRTWEKLKRGKIPIERRLDLHGRTQLEAHEALNGFLGMAAASGMRCVLIVTGKGIDGQGVLRQMVPRWLAEPGNREKIVTYCTAHPRHGGAGALYVLIKRRRAPGPAPTGSVEQER
jgi:DNA-nicking Smr family endonuclease